MWILFQLDKKSLLEANQTFVARTRASNGSMKTTRFCTASLVTSFLPIVFLTSVLDLLVNAIMFITKCLQPEVKICVTLPQIKESWYKVNATPA